MAGAPTRFREREVPPPPLNKVKVGTFYTRRKSDNSIAGTEVVYSTAPGNKQSLERTWDSVNSGPPYRSGGPFMNIKVELPQFAIQGTGVYRTAPDYPDPQYWYQYQGGFSNPSFTGDSLPTTKYMSLGMALPYPPELIPSLSYLCAEVTARLRPKLEKSNVGQQLAELRDLPSMLKTSAKGFASLWGKLGGSSKGVFMNPKGASEHFLNHQFGWAPFIGDLGQLKTTVENQRAFLAKLAKDNNTWKRRIYTVTDDHTSEVKVRNYIGGFFPNDSRTDRMTQWKTVDGNPEVRAYTYQIEENLSKIWAEGSFRYYNPAFDSKLADFDSALNTIDRYLTLYGARINPSLIWKVMPWSWLIDWFTNFGDIIDNLVAQAEDRCVARYMYLMHHRLRMYTNRSVIHMNSGDVVMQWSRLAEIKRREDAPSPYSFCFDWNNLSSMQLAILAALGITRWG